MTKPQMPNMQRAVFLDRDGTINQDSGYISKPEQFEIYPYAGKAINLLNELGFLVFVVTNQSGVARGYYNHHDLAEIHAKMLDQLKKENAHIDKIYISPYWHDGQIEPFNIEHEDRKPGIGMFKKARKEFDVKVSRSYMIGDRYSDIAFGKKAGLTTILVLSGDGRNEFLNNRKSWEYKPDFITENLLSAAKFISNPSVYKK
jgi:D-glycero-D-manno-heptose 1,7-bisphosphate phosphatase